MCSPQYPCRLLLIEDEEQLIDLLLVENQHGKYVDYALDITVARTRAEAIHIIESAIRPFDVISIDPKLPDSSGVDTFDSIQQVSPDPDQPKFIYTGDFDSVFKDIVIRHGAERVIMKGEWSPSQYLTVLHYAACQARARARKRQESEQRAADAEYYKQKWQEATGQLTAIRKKIPESSASRELEEIITSMKLAAAS